MLYKIYIKLSIIIITALATLFSYLFFSHLNPQAYGVVAAGIALYLGWDTWKHS